MLPVTFILDSVASQIILWALFPALLQSFIFTVIALQIPHFLPIQRQQLFLRPTTQVN